MNKIIVILVFFFAILSSVFGQKKEIPLTQADHRFTLKAEKRWAEGDEEYFFTVTNNTGNEYTMVIKVTLDLACVGSSSFLLGYNHTVYLKANGDFNAFEDDNTHIYTSGADYFKDCRLKDGNSFTLFKGIQFSINSIVNLTQQKALAEKKEAEDLKQKQLAEEKKKKEADELNKLAVAKKEKETQEKATPSSYYSNQQGSNNNASAVVAKKPTWEETNARINRENQQKYQEQQNRIAEQQRINQANSEQLMNAANELGNMVGDIIAQARADREKKELKEQQARLRQEQARQEEQERLHEIARKKELQVELRNSLFAEYPEGGVPRSSQKIPVTELYYFTYVFDGNTIGDDSPELSLSNIFPVSQYGDGTWPFKSSIETDIRKSCPGGTISLIGYYTTQELAEQNRRAFLDIANKSNFKIRDITYKGKRATTVGNDDFWVKGSNYEGNSNETFGRAKMRMAKGDEDFWETGQAKKKISEDKKKAESNDDFWKK